MKEIQQSVIPVLRILDVAKAKEFYIDWLGFKWDWEHKFGENFPLYMGISLNGIILHLTEHYGDAVPGARIRIQMPDLKKYHSQLKDYKYYKPSVQRKPWGTDDMCLLDPFGNHIDFFERPNE